MREEKMFSACELENKKCCDWKAKQIVARRDWKGITSGETFNTTRDGFMNENKCCDL